MTELASVLATAADWLAAVHPDDRQEIQDLLNLSDDESAHALPEGPRDRTRSGSRADGRYVQRRARLLRGTRA